MFSLVMGSGFNLLGCFFTRTSNSIDIFPNYAQSKLQMFPYKEIKAATNFQHHLLKEAYGGRLYHGMLKDGREVAVQCLKMFQHNFIEYDVIMKCLPHKNIMSMYGYARHYRETLVVHEYISNVASLAAHLYGEIAESDTLPWLTRLDIAIDTANALCHLHRHGIMHLDVNPSNILLDMNFHAKLANFILSWKFTKNGSVYDEQEVDSVIATVACLDPAYLGSCRANGKNDVHSFGMVLYDLISSKPSRQWIQSETVNYSDDEPDDCLASLLRRNIENQSLVELVDPKLGFQSHHKIKQMMTATAELAFQCMQCPVESRPNMEQVLEILNGIRLIETKHPLEAFRIFHHLELEEATNNFDTCLGKGGFSTVYYGKLLDGREVAVKRFHDKKNGTIQHFEKEIEILSHINHQHLISMYGCSSTSNHRRDEELLLVYEYISNETLAFHLGPHSTTQLPWLTRLNISIQIASALAYLHDSDIIHRDVKPSNILLDDNFGVKVSDFGLSRFLPADATHASTFPQGTPDYIDPEYITSNKVSDKSDVYSFGVLLFQLISSKPPAFMDGPQYVTLANFAMNKILNKALGELVDPRMCSDSDNKTVETITAVAELAFQCVQCPKDLRPSMKQVLETLEGIKQGTWGFNQIT